MRAVTQRPPRQTLIAVTVIEFVIVIVIVIVIGSIHCWHRCLQQLATQLNLDLAITIGQKAKVADTLNPR
jgi:uncharacterized membrane protein